MLVACSAALTAVEQAAGSKQQAANFRSTTGRNLFGTVQKAQSSKLRFKPLVIMLPSPSSQDGMPLDPKRMMHHDPTLSSEITSEDPIYCMIRDEENTVASPSNLDPKFPRESLTIMAQKLRKDHISSSVQTNLSLITDTRTNARIGIRFDRHRLGQLMRTRQEYGYHSDRLRYSRWVKKTPYYLNRNDGSRELIQEETPDSSSDLIRQSQANEMVDYVDCVSVTSQPSEISHQRIKRLTNRDTVLLRNSLNRSEAISHNPNLIHRWTHGDRYTPTHTDHFQPHDHESLSSSGTWEMIDSHSELDASCHEEYHVHEQPIVGDNDYLLQLSSLMLGTTTFTTQTRTSELTTDHVGDLLDFQDNVQIQSQKDNHYSSHATEYRRITMPFRFLKRSILTLLTLCVIYSLQHPENVVDLLYIRKYLLGIRLETIVGRNRIFFQRKYDTILDCLNPKNKAFAVRRVEQIIRQSYNRMLYRFSTITDTYSYSVKASEFQNHVSLSEYWEYLNHIWIRSRRWHYFVPLDDNTMIHEVQHPNSNTSEEFVEEQVMILESYPSIVSASTTDTKLAAGFYFDVIRPIERKQYHDFCPLDEHICSDEQNENINPYLPYFHRRFWKRNGPFMQQLNKLAHLETIRSIENEPDSNFFQSIEEYNSERPQLTDSDTPDDWTRDHRPRKKETLHVEEFFDTPLMEMASDLIRRWKKSKR